MDICTQVLLKSMAMGPVHNWVAVVSTPILLMPAQELRRAMGEFR